MVKRPGPRRSSTPAGRTFLSTRRGDGRGNFFDYGAYEGRTRTDILRERPEWNLWRDGCPQGETVEQVGVRVDRVLSEVRGVDGDVAIFAHGHVLRVLASRWIQQPPAFGERIALGTASVSVLGWENSAEVIWLWNDTSHLQGPGVS